MNRSVRVTLAAVALQALLTACSSVPPAVTPVAEVEQAHQRAIAAFNRCDEVAFLSSYAEKFAFTTSNTRAAFSSREALSAYLAAACRQTPSPQVTLKSQTIRFVGPVALLSGQYNFRVVTQGASSDVTQNFSAVVQQESGAWRVLVHHVSLAP